MNVNTGFTGIALVGFKTQLILGPIFTPNFPLTNKMILLYTKESENTLNDVISNLSHLEIKLEIEKDLVNNIFDFYEIYFTTLKIMRKYKIDWINVTSGPGISIGSIMLCLKDRDVKYVYYHEPKDNKPGFTEIIEGKNLYLFENDKNYIGILKYLYVYHKTYIEKIAKYFKTSESTVSRKLNTLMKMGFIYSIGSGRGNIKKEFELTSLGTKIYVQFFNDYDGSFEHE